MSMVQQMEEMRETIHKLNNELVEKTAKEKSLEEKVVQLLHNHEEKIEISYVTLTTLGNNDEHADNA
ncbi:hypothetical protein CR513_47430, partial [Mucuna pruriens]